MKRVKFSLFALAAIFATSCVQDPIMEESEQTDVVVASKKIVNTPEAAAQNSLILYVDDATADAWSENATRSGNANLDALASDLAVESVDQLFNMQINGAEKRAQGDELSAVVETVLTGDLQSIADITAQIAGEDVTVGKVTYRLRVLTENGKAVKGEIKIPATEGAKARTIVGYKLPDAE